MIDFNYTAPELLPFRIQEVLDAPNEPHRIGGVVYVPEGGVECENLIDPWGVHDVSEPDFECSRCHATGHADGNVTGGEYLFCPRCGAVVKKAVKR